jgi:hypothetical protein
VLKEPRHARPRVVTEQDDAAEAAPNDNLASKMLQATVAALSKRVAGVIGRPLNEAQVQTFTARLKKELAESGKVWNEQVDKFIASEAYITAQEQARSGERRCTSRRA